MRDTGIVDEDRDGAKCFLGGIERAHHCGAVEHVGLDGARLPARSFDFLPQVLQPLNTPRDQRDLRAVLGERLRKMRAQPARSAGHQRDAARQIEEF